MEKNNEENMQQASLQVMKTMESEFLALEHMAFTMSQNSLVKEFVKEENPLIYHVKSEEVSDLLSSQAIPSSFVKSTIIYNQDAVFCRFAGALGNTAAKRIYYLIDSSALPQHMVLDLEGDHYVGYASGIYEGQLQIGTVVLLLDENKLRSLFIENSGVNSLQVSLAADGNVITSSDEQLIGITVNDVRRNTYSVLSRKIGVTPFEVLVSSDGRYINSLLKDFAIISVVVGMMIIILLVLFFFFWNKSFVSPMLTTMRGIELLGTENVDQTLEYTGEVNFDRLVEKINSMIFRLNEKKRELLVAQTKLHNAEIEKQNALIISLKKQINAHFTINVLNNIKLLAKRCEVDKTAEMCDGLAYMLRYANEGDEFIGGLEEFFILEKYIAIMQIRFQNKFTFQFDLDERLDNVKIPRMLIQPIVENSILHGFKQMSDGGIISINATIDSDKLVISVLDNGCGIDKDELLLLREKIEGAEQQDLNKMGLEHIALPNIQKRVVSYYGSCYGLNVNSKFGQGTAITLTLPVYS